jgi:hypothetical protein
MTACEPKNCNASTRAAAESQPRDHLRETTEASDSISLALFWSADDRHGDPGSYLIPQSRSGERNLDSQIQEP